MPDEMTRLAALMFGVPESEVTPEMRARAKTVSYVQHYSATDATIVAALYSEQFKPLPWYHRLWNRLRFGPRWEMK